MSKVAGPFTAHVRLDHPKRGVSVITQERTTLRAAENFLANFKVNVTARWITNPQGHVFTPFACGEPQ